VARYRKVDTRIWNDERFMALSDDAQLAFFLIMTNPHMTGLGAMRATIPGLAAEKRWSTPRFRRAFEEARQVGMVEHDEAAAFVALPNFLRYNQPENPNVVTSWRESLDLIPECRGKHALICRTVRFVESLGEAWSKALPEAFREALAKGMAKQDQEQEQEQEEDPPKAPRRGASGEGPGFSPGEIAWRVMETWRAHLEAWRRFFRAENGVDPAPEPTLTPVILAAIQGALRVHDRDLLGPDQREEWKASSKVRAAGIGIYLSPWHTGKDPKNNSRNGGRQYLEHDRPWRIPRGKTDPVEVFAPLYFEEKRRANRR
jgi:hypothetical protein